MHRAGHLAKIVDKNPTLLLDMVMLSNNKCTMFKGIFSLAVVSSQTFSVVVLLDAGKS